MQQAGNCCPRVFKFMTFCNLHLRLENLQLSEDVLLYPGISCGSKGHHWNRGELLAKHIHSFIILAKIMSPLVGKKNSAFQTIWIFLS